MNHDEYCDLVTAEIDTLASLLETADPDTPVPTCPGWDLAGMAKHLGVVQRWATQMMATGAADRLDFREVDRQLPDSPAGYPAWLRANGQALVDQLRSGSPEDEVFTWGPGGNKAWWARRIAHETTVHRVDAEIAVGRPAEIDPEAAVDGIDEFLENLPMAGAFAPKAGELAGHGERIHFHATDADGEWIITLGQDGFDWTHGHEKGEVAVRAPAGALLLLVYGRADVNDESQFQRFGDAALLDRWLDIAKI